MESPLSTDKAAAAPPSLPRPPPVTPPLSDDLLQAITTLSPPTPSRPTPAALAPPPPVMPLRTQALIGAAPSAPQSRRARPRASLPAHVMRARGGEPAAARALPSAGDAAAPPRTGALIRAPHRYHGSSGGGGGGGRAPGHHLVAMIAAMGAAAIERFLQQHWPRFRSGRPMSVSFGDGPGAPGSAGRESSSGRTVQVSLLQCELISV